MLTTLMAFFANKDTFDPLTAKTILAKAELEVADVHVRYAVEYAQKLMGPPDKRIEEYTYLAGLSRPATVLVFNRALTHLDHVSQTTPEE